MTSQLVHFYESLKTEADIDALVQAHRPEDLYLEFKRKAGAPNDILGDGDKKAFSKAVSGFANADGGILVFGVDTVKQSGIDVAAGLHPFAHPATVKARLGDSLLNTTHPPVDDVRIDVIPSDITAGEGYVKCLIPASDRPPHRAVVADHWYYRRCSTGHRRMEHYELEDMFGRRLRPKLALFAQVTPDPHNQAHEELRLFFLNEGRAVSRHSGLICILNQQGAAIVQTQGLSNISDTNARPTLQYYQSMGVIHPNGIMLALGRAIIARENLGQPLDMTVKWYAENMAARQAKAMLAAGAMIQIQPLPLP